MSLISNGWQPGLTQSGPPCWSNSPVEVKPYVCNNVEELRRICFAPSDLRTPDGRSIPKLALLTGEFSEYDGQLQGFYLRHPPSSADPENGGSTIYSHDGKNRWKKITG